MNYRILEYILLVLLENVNIVNSELERKLTVQ